MKYINKIKNLKDIFIIKVKNYKSDKLRLIISNNKRYLLFNFIILILMIIGTSIVFNNYNWYDTTIVKIDNVENTFDHEVKGNRGETEKYYNQELMGTILNGKLEGKTVYMKNQYTFSGVYDDEYKAGDEVFITLNNKNNDKLVGSISGLKRDKYMAVLFTAFFMLIVLVINKRGLLTIISLIINIGIFLYAIHLYIMGKNILSLSIVMVIVFTCLSLILISGLNKKTFAAIISTLISICFTMLIFKIVMAYTGVDYAFMEYLVNPNDLPEIFMSQILLGGLGATMDVSITMSSTISELINKNNDISANSLFKSGREVGHDIMGTMINVMMFTYICGTIPIIVLKMKNDISLTTIIMRHIPFELYRFLIGSIGILLSIPISLLISIILFKKLRRF
ncbi:YibE/F family protein [Anaerovorax odorimutans]|uniref:YibE/F family protein n=1 Tax=Anaerovorax odorimutans TaxID=109327 RepID=UPI0003F80562|nr:YibE/F family protein [Anaerovorax odorimutans]